MRFDASSSLLKLSGMHVAPRRPSSERAQKSSLSSLSASALLASALLFNLVLCFINANLIPVSNVHVISCELIILGLAFLVARSAIGLRQLSFLVLLVAYLSFLVLVRSQTSPAGLDVKIIRDFLIPVAFYCLGTTISLKQVDRLLTCMVIVVLAIGIFENFFLEFYSRYLNVIGYYIARGTAPDSENVRQAAGGLMVSGLRPTEQGRQLLPWLLDGHRISSVFLEPSSLGNFGIIVVLWATVRSRIDQRIWWALALSGLACIILADTRFAATFLPLGLLILIIPISWSTAVVFIMPAAAVLFLLMLVTPADLMSNDTGGRLAYASLVMHELGYLNWIGFLDSALQTYDAGYGYLLSSVGVLGAVALWCLFMTLKGRTPHFYAFRNAAGAYLSVLFLISQSQMTIKTAAFLWVAIGALAVAGAGQDPLSEQLEPPSPMRSGSSPQETTKA